jgi:hypothetical protein
MQAPMNEVKNPDGEDNISGWKNFLETNLFEKEAKLLEECKNTIKQVEEYINLMYLTFTSDDGKKIDADIVNKYKVNQNRQDLDYFENTLSRFNSKFWSIIKNASNPDKDDTAPMIKPLTELNEDLINFWAEFDKFFETTEAYQYKNAYDKLVERFPGDSKHSLRRSLYIDLKNSPKSFYGTLTNFQKENQRRLLR